MVRRRKALSDKEMRKRLVKPPRRRGLSAKKYREMVLNIRRVKYRELIIKLRQVMGLKQIILVGRQRGRPVVKQVIGRGRELYRKIVDEMDSDRWDAKPKVFS